MQPKKSKSIEANPWAAMDAMINQTKEPMGEEWFYASDFAARYNLSIGRASSRLRELAGLGAVEAWKGCGGSHKRTTCKYRPAKTEPLRCALP
jgi:hypothetical protein